MNVKIVAAKLVLVVGCQSKKVEAVKQFNKRNGIK